MKICFLLLLGLLPFSCPMEHWISPREAQELSRASAQTTSETGGVHPTPASPLPRNSEDSLSGKTSGTNELACSISPTSGNGAFSDKVNSPVEDDTIDSASLPYNKRKRIVLDSTKEQGTDSKTQPGNPIHQIHEPLLASSKKPNTKDNVAVVPPFPGVAKEKASLRAAPSLPINTNANTPLEPSHPKTPAQEMTISEVAKRLKGAEESSARGLTDMELKLFSTRLLISCRTGLKPPFALQLGPALLERMNVLLSKFEGMVDRHGLKILPSFTYIDLMPGFFGISKDPVGVHRMSVLVPLLEFLVNYIPEVLPLYEVSTQAIVFNILIYTKAHLSEFGNLPPEFQYKVLMLLVHSIFCLQIDSYRNKESDLTASNTAHKAFQRVIIFLLFKAQKESHSQGLSLDLQSSWEPPLWLDSQIGRFLVKPLSEVFNSERPFQSANFLGASIATYFVHNTYIFLFMKNTMHSNSLPREGIQSNPIKVTMDGSWVELIKWGSLPNKDLLYQVGTSIWLKDNLEKINPHHPLLYFLRSLYYLANKRGISGANRWEDVLPEDMKPEWRMIIKNIFTMQGDHSLHAATTILGFFSRFPSTPIPEDVIYVTTDLKAMKLLAMLIIQFDNESKRIWNLGYEIFSVIRPLYQFKPDLWKTMESLLTYLRIFKNESQFKGYKFDGSSPWLDNFFSRLFKLDDVEPEEAAMASAIFMAQIEPSYFLLNHSFTAQIPIRNIHEEMVAYAKQLAKKNSSGVCHLPNCKECTATQ
ncbi:hypothetical protein CROQUDRAFT_129679 [Cronartium quercuum f. sp. fusiforme G11]|uniref:Uncharacterized protein n=1 Tax=Cronartium quercuum f. sp. fusiforme G11 TaxID=708437 RepID=A0A9P6THN6_9BASI|nr:hypothetical protein CROQUDRAFT_129679 [Cronartium quercuum f. sp. fusiforme G11]